MNCTKCETCGCCKVCTQPGATTDIHILCQCIKITLEPKGWICPVCNGGVAPTAQRCPCVPTPTPVVYGPIQPQPTIVPWVQPGWGSGQIIGEVTIGDPPGTCGSGSTLDTSKLSLQ